MPAPKATIRKGAKGQPDIIIVEVECNPSPVSSASGKSLVVASTHGNHPTTLIVDGKPVIVSVNAYTKL